MLQLARAHVLGVVLPNKFISSITAYIGQKPFQLGFSKRGVNREKLIPFISKKAEHQRYFALLPCRVNLIGPSRQYNTVDHNSAARLPIRGGHGVEQGIRLCISQAFDRRSAQSLNQCLTALVAVSIGFG